MNDRVALITGGGTGIGAATARLFAEAGAAVCVTGRRQAPLEEVVAAVREAGGRAISVSGDVAVTADCQRMVDEATSAFGQVDILVNNAGTATLMDADETTDELWDQTIGTNLSGAFRLIRTVLPGMVSRRSGCIVNVSSVLAQSGMKRTAAYGASKAGLDQLTPHPGRRVRGPRNTRQRRGAGLGGHAHDGVGSGPCGHVRSIEEAPSHGPIRNTRRSGPCHPVPGLGRGCLDDGGSAIGGWRMDGDLVVALGGSQLSGARPMPAWRYQ